MAASDFRRRRVTGAQQQPRRSSQHHDDDLRDSVLVTALAQAPALLPQNEIAERALIGSAFIDPDDVLASCAFVKPQYFFRAENGTVWRQLLALHEQGTSIDPITVTETLQFNHLLDEVGGIDAIMAYGNGVPHSAHAKDYAKIVCEKYAARYSLSANAALTRAGHRGDVREIAAAWAASQAEMQEVFLALGITATGAQEGPRHRLKSIAEMRKRTRPEWLIPGILQERKRSLIFGDSNTGKSFLALDMALSIATGLPWHGRSVKWGSVVYVCAEDEDGVIDRINVWLEHHHLKDAPHFWLVDDSPNLLESGEVGNLITQINHEHDEPPALVIFDTLAASTPGGDENSAQDMGIAIGALHRVQRECGCGVLAVHHSGKDPTKGPRGNSSLRADVDTALEVSADENTGLITVRGNKVRGDDKRKINMGFRLRQFAVDDHADFTSCILEALDEPPSPPASAVRRKPTASDKLLELMQEIGSPQLHGQLCTAFIKGGYGNRATFNRVLQELYDRRLIENINGLYQRAATASPKEEK